MAEALGGSLVGGSFHGSGTGTGLCQLVVEVPGIVKVEAAGGKRVLSVVVDVGLGKELQLGLHFAQLADGFRPERLGQVVAVARHHVAAETVDGRTACGVGAVDKLLHLGYHGFLCRRVAVAQVELMNVGIGDAATDGIDIVAV